MKLKAAFLVRRQRRLLLLHLGIRCYAFLNLILLARKECLSDQLIFKALQNIVSLSIIYDISVFASKSEYFCGAFPPAVTYIY